MPLADGSLLGIESHVGAGGTLLTDRGDRTFRAVPGVAPLTELNRLSSGGYLATGVLGKN